MTRRLVLAAAAILTLAAGAMPAAAGPNVFVNPLCLNVTAGQLLTVHLSVATPEPISCFYAVLAYNPSVIAVLDVREGNLFTSSPDPRFPGWQQTAPDSIETFNCVLGSGTFVVGPGNLADIDIQGLATSFADLHITFIDVRDIARASYPNVRIVTCAQAGVPEEPVAGAPAPRLAATPNPAPPGPVRIEVLGTAPPGRIAIYDVAGRLRRLLGGGDGGSAWNWDGRDEHGRLLPPGLYLLRGSPPEELTTKLLLVR